MFFTFLALCSSSVLAERLAFTNSGSKIQMHMTASLHEIDGEAQKFQGFFNIEDTESSGEVTIQADSLTTFLGVRDEKMLESTLDVNRFPNLVFTIHRIEGAKKNTLTEERYQINDHTGSGEVLLHGSLKIARVSREVSIPAAYRWEDGGLRLIGSTTLKWPDFNLPDPSIFISTLQPPVDVKFSIYATKNQ